MDTPGGGHLQRVFGDLLRETQRAQGDEIADCLSRVLRPVDLDACCYLVDEEQRVLRALPRSDRITPRPIELRGTIPGRVYTTTTTLTATGADGVRTLWLPLLDGTERLGVVAVTGRWSDDDAFLAWCETLVNLVGHLIAVKMRYGDLLHRVRRTRPMSVASELLLPMLPPLTFTCDRMVISCILEPFYEIGGDAFDYAFDGPYAYLCLLDALGHGLGAGIMAVTALAAMRAVRRDGGELEAMAEAVDDVFAGQFAGSAFVTAFLGRLHLGTGRLRYINAGHPRPLLLRGGQAVRELRGGRRLPLGLEDRDVEVAEESLQPGDRILLFSDGVVEARDAHGDLFGVERLTDLVEQTGLARLPTPETLRTVAHRVIEFNDGPLRDDATLMLVDWSRAAAERVIPPHLR